MISVAVVPLTVQTVGVDDVKLTGNPELAVADNVRVVGGVAPRVWAGIVPKVMVCDCSAGVTAKL